MASTSSRCDGYSSPETSRPDSPSSVEDADISNESRRVSASLSSIASSSRSLTTIQRREPRIQQYDFGKHYRSSYLNQSQSQQKQNAASTSSLPQHKFVRPENFSYGRLTIDSHGRGRRWGAGGIMSTLGGSNAVSMTSLRSRRRTPSPNRLMNEEPIRLSTYPRGRPSSPQEEAAIERLDWPCPAAPAALLPEIMAERRRRRSEGKEEADSDEEVVYTDPKLEREIQVMRRSAGSGSTLASAILQDLERKWLRVQQLRMTFDPHNASRAPAADHELPVRLRYESAMFASPSRILTERRRSEPEARAQPTTGATLPSFSAEALDMMNLPKPGYGLAPKSTRSLPAAGRHAQLQNSAYNRFSTDSSYDVFDGNSTIDDKSTNHTVAGFSRDAGINDVADEGFRYKMCLAYDRRSFGSSVSQPPPKIFPYNQLVLTNVSRPRDADPDHLEQHLSIEEFRRVFSMTQHEFRQLPEWKQNDLKRRALLF